jgi:hypothetical protein
MIDFDTGIIIRLLEGIDRILIPLEDRLRAIPSDKYIPQMPGIDMDLYPAVESIGDLLSQKHSRPLFSFPQYRWTLTLDHNRRFHTYMMAGEKTAKTTEVHAA